MYGIQTSQSMPSLHASFENDVKMYGIQTWIAYYYIKSSFENDVKMYGIQTQKIEEALLKVV